MAHMPERSRANELMVLTNLDVQTPEPPQRCNCLATDPERRRGEEESGSEGFPVKLFAQKKKLAHGTRHHHCADQHEQSQGDRFTHLARDRLSLRGQFDHPAGIDGQYRAQRDKHCQEVTHTRRFPNVWLEVMSGPQYFVLSRLSDYPYLK